MDAGFFTTGLLTGLREGVEAALIVSIVLAYLAKTGNQRYFGRIWAGVVAAIGVSVGIGLVLWMTIGGLEEPAEQVFEGLTMLLAAAVVTWMLFWMRRTSANIRGELHAGIDRALTDGGAWALSILAFTAVIREGIETSLFLLGQITAAGDAEVGALSTLVGALSGMVVAIGIGYAFYRGAQVINLADLLPLDRDRPDLHRRWPAQPCGPRVRGDRRDHRWHLHRFRHQRGAAARG